MRKTTLDVADLVSTLDFAGVQKRVLALPGVNGAEMTAASSSVTVIYDPAQTDAASIATEIKACGFHCRGESVPKHVCLPDSTAVPPEQFKARLAAVPVEDPHAGHAGMTPAAMAAMDAAPAEKTGRPRISRVGMQNPLRQFKRTMLSSALSSALKLQIIPTIRRTCEALPKSPR